MTQQRLGVEQAGVAGYVVRERVAKKVRVDVRPDPRLPRDAMHRALQDLAAH